MNPFLFGVVYLVPLSVLTGFYLGGWFIFFTPVVVFGIVPLLDLLLKDYTVNPTSGEEQRLLSDIRYKLLTWFCAPLQCGLVVWACIMVWKTPISGIEFVGLTVSLGISSGILGINVAHELVHRVNRKLESFLGQLMLSTCLYMHWGLEHVVGHHRSVATPEDPATARLGEGFFLFLPRTIIGGLVNVFQFERSRLKRNNTWFFSLKNRFLKYILIESATLVAIYLCFPRSVLILFVGQSLVAICLLEIVNYIEHYGLLRNQVDGKYESTKPWHSWNSSNLLTNLFLFNLQRHSDHHYKPGRRYQILRHFDESPQLPTGYAGMIWLAVIPPLWKRIMNPRVEQLNNKNAERSWQGKRS